MNPSISSTLSLFLEGISHFKANCSYPPSLMEALLVFHKEKFFHAYDSIMIDYNFSPGSYPEDRWAGIISKTLPAIAETNLLASSGTVLVPDWDMVGTEVAKSQQSINQYYDVKHFEDREQHPLHQATMAAVNAEELQLLNNAKKGYYIFKLKNLMTKDRAIYALENIMKSSRNKRDPDVILAFDRMRGYSPRFPIILDNEDQLSQTSPAAVFEGLLEKKVKNKTIRFVGRIDPEGKFYYEVNTWRYE